MSRFLSERYRSLEPYTPGEQPKCDGLIKLNTNENPFPPSPGVTDAINSAELGKLNLYPDPEAKDLIEAASRYYGVPENMIMAGNGSDELLAFSFMAFQKNGRIAFPDISYGFYEVYAGIFGATALKIPLDDSLKVNIDDYCGAEAMIVLANPNAQTGTAVGLDEIEKVLKTNENSVVLVDEAYVNFGAESSLQLTQKYDNLLVIQTFSKARNLAGGRVGLAFADSEIIKDLNKIKYSFNPYNLNRLSILAAVASINDDEYFKSCVGQITDTRKIFVGGMEELGFFALPSLANFVLVRHDKISGAEFYRELRERNILVRHFNDRRIADYVRITIGGREDMAALTEAAREILARRD